MGGSERLVRVGEDFLVGFKLPVTSINRTLQLVYLCGAKRTHVTLESGEIQVRDPCGYLGEIRGISIDQVRDPCVIFRGDL